MIFERYSTPDAPPPHPSEPEQVPVAPTSFPSIPGYEFLGPLGSGGSGTVWHVRDGAGQEAALKLLHPAESQTETARERLHREARLVNKVRGNTDSSKGDGLARVLDIEADALTPFVVTELVRGPTLEQLAGDSRGLPLGQVLALGLELGEILDRVHDAEFAHRDLKPGNVIISESGPVLIDFGIAQGDRDPRLTSTGFVTGTPGYVAPELLQMEVPSPEDWKDGDWFALSALLCFAATGRPPFGAGQTEATLHRVFTGDVDTDGLDEQSAQAFRAALAPRPEDRISTRGLLETLSWQPDQTKRLQDQTKQLDQTLQGGLAQTEIDRDDWGHNQDVPGWSLVAPYVHAEPKRTWWLALLFFAVLAAIPAKLGPGWLALGPASLLLTQVAGRVELSVAKRRKSWGAKRDTDAAVAWATSPWAFFVASAALLPGLAAGFATFVAAGSLGQYLVLYANGDAASITDFWHWLFTPALQSLLSPWVLALAGWLGFVLCWSLPTSLWSRTGTYRIIQSALPNVWWRLIFGALLLLALIGMAAASSFLPQ